MRAPTTVHPGIDSAWLPEERDAVDWVRLIFHEPRCTYLHPEEDHYLVRRIDRTR